MRVEGINKTSAVRENQFIPRTAGPTSQTDDFRKTLQTVLSAGADLKFSNHAINRLTTRGVHLDDRTMSRLGRAVMAADDKGAAQSLVLLDEMAFLVSVKNRTIITAMETSQMKEGVITRIDSAVIG
jgi:flagellar operon protein